MNNLNKLDQSCRDSNHINCVRFAKGESIKHKLAKCIAGILASEGVPIEDIAVFIEHHNLCKDGSDCCPIPPMIDALETWASEGKTKDNQDFIQEARMKHFYCSVCGEIDTDDPKHLHSKSEDGTPLRQVEYRPRRRVDHWQIKLNKCLEFETDKRIKKEGSITVYL